MTRELLLGAGTGAGLLLVLVGLVGLFPRRASLADMLARLRTVPIVIDTRPANGGIAARAGRPIARLLERMGCGGLVWSGVRRDLAVLERSSERHLAEKVALCIVGLVLPLAVTALLALGGAHLPLVLPIWVAVVLGIAFFFVPDLGVHHEASTRRRDFRHALSSFLDLVVIDLAGGGGVETALADAISVGSGWAFTRLRRSLEDARLARETPWSALGRLGREIGVGELEELAASVGLAGTEGAKVRASLAAKATSIRVHELTEAEESDQATTERMSLPVVCLFAGFLLFVGFPAIERVLTGL